MIQVQNGALTMVQDSPSYWKSKEVAGTKDINERQERIADDNHQRCTEATECQHHLRVIYDEKQNEARSHNTKVFKKISCESGVIAESKNHRQSGQRPGVDHGRPQNSKIRAKHRPKDKQR